MKGWELGDAFGVWKRAWHKGKRFNYYDAADAVAKAYQKKLVEWSEEICSDETHNNLTHHTIRRHCPVCWQELLDDLGVG